MKPFDEMLENADQARLPYRSYEQWFAAQDRAQLARKSTDAERAFRRTGITFAVYGDEQASERLRLSARGFTRVLRVARTKA